MPRRRWGSASVQHVHRHENGNPTHYPRADRLGLLDALVSDLLALSDGIAA